MEGEKKNRESELERVWRKRKRRGGDRDNNVCGGDSIEKKNVWMKGKREKRYNIKNKNNN